MSIKKFVLNNTLKALPYITKFSISILWLLFSVMFLLTIFKVTNKLDEFYIDLVKNYTLFIVGLTGGISIFTASFEPLLEDYLKSNELFS